MIRTISCALSISGIALVKKKNFVVNASSNTSPVDDVSRTFEVAYPEKVIVQTYLNHEDLEVTNPWMAEPMTDEDTRNANPDSMRIRMELMIMKAQRDFCLALENEEDPRYKFRVDRWKRTEGGGGVSCILQDGRTFEKAGVNVSVVHGIIPPKAVAEMNSRGKKLPANKEMKFFACGISSVIHPKNPMVPTIHFNYRYFEVEEEPGKHTWWFGGGCDLTPYYLDEADAKQFHKHLKTICDRHNNKFYPKFKAWCDEYFSIKHRNITRGIGGIFFDDLDKPDAEACYGFVKDCADSMRKIYLPMVKKHREDPYGYSQKHWQLIRRGHYAEFNLVYDRGTKFGLNTPGARHESILMSLPPESKWEYMHTVKNGSDEAKLMDVLRNPKDWV